VSGNASEKKFVPNFVRNPSFHYADNSLYLSTKSEDIIAPKVTIQNAVNYPSQISPSEYF
jgi:hypothetical protein